MVEPEAMPRGHLGGGDLGLALAADDHGFVADTSVRRLGQIDPGVLE